MHPSAEIALDCDEIHIYRISIDDPAIPVRILEQSLSIDEKQRAERFHFDLHGRRFIVSRGMLRFVLSRYLMVNPDELDFSYNDFGKPELSNTNGDNAIRFNVSHSGEMALYALARDREIGVDIEKIRPFPNAGQIVERFFSPWERDNFRSLPPCFRQTAFFNCWTRKEAYIKARGMGMSMALDQFSVSLAPFEPARLVEDLQEEGGESAWLLNDIAISSDYVAAVAIENGGGPHRSDSFGARLSYKSIDCCWGNHKNPPGPHTYST